MADDHGSCPAHEVTRLDSRWQRCEGVFQGHPFNACIAVGTDGTSLMRLLEEQGVHRGTSLEDATLALAAGGSESESGLRCTYLRNGAHVHEYAGPEGAPTVVLLHALAGNLHTWTPISEDLRGHVRLVLVDLPGHGRSASRLPGPPSRIAAQAVAWLDSTFEELDVARPHLVGHSLGGRIAAYYAATGRRELASLTLVAPALRPAMTGLRGAASRAASLMAVFRGRTGARWVAGLVFFDMLIEHTVRNRRLVGYALQDMLHEQEQQGYSGVRLALAWLRSAPDDRDIDWAAVVARHPVHAFFGAEDHYCPLSRHPGLEAAGVTVTEVAGTGHLLPLEAPEVVLAVLRQHL